MEEALGFDFSQHPYCIQLYFDEEKAYVNSFFSGIQQSNKEQVNYVDLSKEEKASILYDARKKTILENGKNGDNAQRGENLVYIENILMELNEVYLNTNTSTNKPDQSNSDQDKSTDKLDKTTNELDKPINASDKLRYKMILEAVDKYLLQLKKDGLRGEDSGPEKYSSYHFAVTIPSHWDVNIKNDFLRSLYIENFLIEKNNDRNRLLVYTQLESKFRFLQSLRKDLQMDEKIVNGKKYILYGLRMINDTVIITLDLFSAHYPSLETDDANYVTKSIKSVYATVSPPFLKRNEQGEITQESYMDWFSCIKEEFTAAMEKLSGFRNNQVCTAIFLASDKYPEKSSFNILLNNHIIEWLKSTANNEFNTKLMYFGGQKSIIANIEKYETMEGTKSQIREQIKKCNKSRAPSIISFKKYQYNSSKPDYIINIDIMYKAIKFSCVPVENNRLIGDSPGYTECTIKPLDDFFVRRNKYQKPLLRISDRLKLFMGKKITDAKESSKAEEIIENSHVYDIQRALTNCQYNNREKIYVEPRLFSMAKAYCQFKKKRVRKRYNHFLRKTRLKLDLKFEENALKDFFSENMSKSSTSDKNFTFTHQKKYIRLFLIMYLKYVKEIIQKKVKEVYGIDSIDKNTGYIISIENILMDDLFKSENAAQDLLKECNIPSESNEYEKPHIVKRGENILSAIQYNSKLKPPLPLQTYFVVTQLHLKYIQITLHQVVETESDELDASSIIVRDKMIPIDNVVDTICNHIWKHVELCGKINYCTEHKNKEYSTCTFYSQQIYKNAIDKLKEYVSNILKSDKTNPDLDAKKCIEINTCHCSIDISTRYFIETGLKPYLQSCTSIISAAMVNNDLFGHYSIAYLFIIEEIFKVEPNSVLHKSCKLLLQHAIELSIGLTKRNIVGIVLKDSLCHILQQHVQNKKKPYMYDNFIEGNLRHVSSETYGLRIAQETIDTFSNFSLSFKPENEETSTKVEDPDSGIVVFKKGQVIPDTGFVMKFDFICSGQKKRDSILTKNVIELELVRMRPSENTELDKIVYLKSLPYHNRLSTFCFSFPDNTPVHLLLELKPFLHNSSFQISIRKKGGETDAIDDNCKNKNVIIDEHLTLAHFKSFSKKDITNNP